MCHVYIVASWLVKYLILIVSEVNVLRLVVQVKKYLCIGMYGDSKYDPQFGPPKH